LQSGIKGYGSKIIDHRLYFHVTGTKLRKQLRCQKWNTIQKPSQILPSKIIKDICRKKSNGLWGKTNQGSTVQETNQGANISSVRLWTCNKMASAVDLPFTPPGKKYFLKYNFSLLHHYMMSVWGDK
jgi:hypothetical protein